MPSLAGLVRRKGGDLALPLLQPPGDLPVEGLHPEGERQGVLTVLAVVGEVTERTGNAGSVAGVAGWSGTVAGPDS